MYCVICPVAAITMMVVRIVINRIGIQMERRIGHASKSPVAAGRNIIGMISIRKFAVSLTCANFMIPVHRAINKRISP